MTMSLLPTDALSSPAQDAPREVGYPPSYEWDFNTGDFVRSNGRVRLVDGYSAWVQWCIKTVLTERYTYLIYSRYYGVELRAATRMPQREMVEARVARTITEALSMDPRTGTVGPFTFRWESGALHVLFRITPRVGTRSENLTIAIPAADAG